LIGVLDWDAELLGKELGQETFDMNITQIPLKSCTLMYLHGDSSLSC